MSYRQSDSMLPGELDDLPSVDEGDREWLNIVRTSYEASTDFLDDGVRTEWEASLARFHSEHPPGSKYYSSAYKGRSKIFRPKTRSFSRRAESTAAKALFSNTDLVDVRGQDRGSVRQAASARLYKALLQYRLEHSIPWFLTAMGARQDAFNYGICCSLSSWDYEVEEIKTVVPVMDEMGQSILDEDGQELGEEVTELKVKTDKPSIKLIPPENIRFDANADWRDPIGTSPVVTVMLPMYCGEVLDRMDNPQGVDQAAPWKTYDIKEILAASQDKTINEVIRQARQGRERMDPLDLIEGDENTPVWVYLNIVKKDGKDVAFYTLGKTLMLSDPKPVDEVLPLGREALTVGFSIVESHRAYPIGGNKLAAPMQAEINDVTNQRMDNVKLALNKRYLLRRNRNIDQAALMRSVPGGGVMTDDPDTDVRVLDYPDVTSSSYQEQNLLAAELDELSGNFSGSSVQASRSLNETVGGMNLLQSDASDVSEYELRTFVETWVEPVLRKLQKLEAMFETDERVLQLSAENAELFQQYGRALAVDQLLDEELVVSVNVGMGNTNPMQRLQKFTGVLMAAAQIPEIAESLNAEEVGKEMFAMGGYSEGTRFFITQDEKEQREQKKMQMMEQMKAQQQPQQNHQVEVAQIRAEVDRERLSLQKQIEGMRTELKMLSEENEQRRWELEMASERDIKTNELYEKIGLEDRKRKDNRQGTSLKEVNRMREMSIKERMGSGI